MAICKNTYTYQMINLEQNTRKYYGYICCFFSYTLYMLFQRRVLYMFYIIIILTCFFVEKVTFSHMMAIYISIHFIGVVCVCVQCMHICISPLFVIIKFAFINEIIASNTEQNQVQKYFQEILSKVNR